MPHARTHTRTVARVFRSPIDVISWDAALARVADWASRHESRYVCFCNVHSVVTADRDAAFGRVVAQADMTLPDGAPVVWVLRQQGHGLQQRINGPDFMWRYFALAQRRRESVYLYGNTADTLARLQTRLRSDFPDLVIAGIHSPPFRALTPEEDEAVIRDINASGAQTVWVSLGCPKQEAWMAAHKGRIGAVMLAVGVAFDYHSGHVRRAPQWMQNCGLEWLVRLCTSPLRLWRRYLVTNTLFTLGLVRQFVLRR